MEKEDLTNPNHYQLKDGLQVIDVQAKELTGQELVGYLKGCAIKYAFRQGKKRHINTDMALKFLNALPKDNEAILKDDVVRLFTMWQSEINHDMTKTDLAKRTWYENRMLTADREKIALIIEKYKQ